MMEWKFFIFYRFNWNIFYSTSLDSGAYRLDTICLSDDCYNNVCDSGTSQSEVLCGYDEYNRSLGICGAPYMILFV